MLFSYSQPTAQILMPVSANMTPSEICRVLDFNQIKHIHFGHLAMFSSTGLLVALVEFRPFTTMSEVKVNQWDELSQFLFHENGFTNPIATNGKLLEEFMLAIGWRTCSTKNEQFGLYGGVGKIENAKDEWRNQGANVMLFGCILVNYEDDIPANQGACKFASALTFTMNQFKNSPHLDKDASLYASGWFPTVEAIPYVCAGSDNAKNSLCLCRRLTIHMRILTLVKFPDNAETFLHLCRLPKIHTPILMLVKVPDNAKNSLRLIRLPTIHKPILMLVKVPNNAENFLHLCRLPTIQTPILTLVKVPNKAKNSLCLCRLPTIHIPILTLVKVPDNLNNSIHD
ncbi:hypothetical protein O181_096113 [Austropuccinia psidii MF-1]|uniref:Tet-like 2OG-Fe(II) oxygenase domain-containing protein n=1 Tax=Austropuccinia psidii MF-1 TaxID=1389203 RepID=A0A9Q3PBW3_9BASI|nr:hypothetical protein [Austropuccinia psidii MF-1]